MNDEYIKLFKRWIEEMIKAKVKKAIKSSWNGLTINFSYEGKTGIIRFSSKDLSYFNSLYRAVLRFY